jgi:hypothetical protein
LFFPTGLSVFSLSENFIEALFWDKTLDLLMMWASSDLHLFYLLTVSCMDDQDLDLSSPHCHYDALWRASYNAYP